MALVGVALLFGGLTVAYEAGAYQHSVEDAPATVNYSDPTQLDAPDRALNYSDTVTVTVDGATLDPGTDYEFSASNGTVTWLNSSNTSSGETALVDYAYRAPSENAAERRGVLSPVVSIAPWAALALGAGAAIKLMEGGW